MKPKKIILIVVDTLRADHLGCYGYERNTSPNIDKIANDGVLFRWAFSPISYTTPAITSIFTSKYPSKHSTGFSNGVPVRNKDIDIFLPEILSSENYETSAFVSGLVLSRESGVVIPSGFRVYDDKMTKSELNRPLELIRGGEDTNKEIFKWLDENHSKNFFLFIHYFDVHGPYVNPEPYNEIFVNDEFYGAPDYIDMTVPDGKAVKGIPDYQVLSPVRDHDGKLLDFEKDIRYYKAQYDGGIRYCDENIGFFVKKLKELGIFDDCLLIITSDHGEAMGENGVYFFHGLTVTIDQIGIPLIIKPNKEWAMESRIITEQVSSIDIMPTILELFGFDYKDLELQGKSLVKSIDKGSDLELQNRTIMAEIEGQQAFINFSEFITKPKEVNTKKLIFYYIEDLCKKERIHKYRENNTIEFTGERFVPWIEGAQLHYEHIHRYAFASLFVKGKKVLDLACGEGYGSHILSNKAGYVVGIEIDEKTVEHARNKYSLQNLVFIQGSILEIPIQGTEKFDVIVCFEGLEHIDEHEKLLSEVKRLLKRDGLFIVSSPNKKTHGDNPNYINPFHKKELYFNDFKNLLEKNFKFSKFLGQKVYAMSNIWQLTPYSHSIYEEFFIEKKEKEFDFAEINKKNPQIFIAIASDKKLDQEDCSISNLLDVSNTLLIGEFQQHIKNLEKIITNREMQISDLSDLGRHARNLEGIIGSKDEHISNLEQHARNLEGIISNKDEQIKDLDASLQEKNAQNDEFVSTINAKDVQLKALETSLQEKNAQNDEFVSTINAKEVQLKALEISLQEKNAQVDELTSALQKEIQIQNLETHMLDKSTQVIDLLNSVLKAKDAQVVKLTSALQSRDTQIKELENSLQSKNTQIADLSSVVQSTQESIVWRLLMRYNDGFVERAFPRGTGRRRMYDLGLKSGRIIVNEGLKAFFWHIRAFFKSGKKN